MSIVKNSLLSLALAGSLSITEFTESAKDFFPNTSLQELNKEKKAIKEKKNFLKLSDEQLIEHKDQLDVMLSVNKRTFEDFFPTLDVSLQKWVKEDISTVNEVLIHFDKAFDIRLKQYENLKNIYKNSNVPEEMFSQINNMVMMTKEAKRKIKELKSQVIILVEVKKTFEDLNSYEKFDLNDYWLSSIEKENNILMVDIKNIDKNDFARIAKIEEELNQKLVSNNIDFVSVA